ncbi:MAG: VWA domain-containing protein [Bacteroidia bacterium]|nr:VWA domain-containing protein [Bacteroidia bacterium]
MHSAPFTPIPRGVAASLLLLPFLFLSAYGQPQLDLKRIANRHGSVELYFQVECVGQPQHVLTEQNIVITDNGNTVDAFSLWCPDPRMEPTISASLVLCASGSMNGEKLQMAKDGASAFVDMMDGVLDEAMVVFFGSNVTVYQQMTTIKPLLHSAVQALPSTGYRALYDGMYAGIVELINNGINPFRGIVVLTDGIESASSTHDAQDIIGLAQRHRLKVFPIELRSTSMKDVLEDIATETGGRYYNADSGDSLIAAFRDAYRLLAQPPEDCIITYNAPCADGALHMVDLTVRDICDGTDTGTLSYRAPLDSSSFLPIVMEFGDATVQGGKQCVLPLQLLTPLGNTMFEPLQFDVAFDTSCLRLDSVTAPDHSLLNGMPLILQPKPEGVRVLIADRRFLNAPGLLLEFAFTTVATTTDRSCTVSASGAGFEQGCHLPVIRSGMIEIVPHTPKPEIACVIDGPRTLRWDRATAEYIPNPILVSLRAYNTGDATGLNARARISFDSTVFLLSSPKSTEQQGSPPDLAPNSFTEFTWQLSAKHRAVPDSSVVCIVSSYDNHAEQSCCIRVYVPAMGAALNCAVSVPPVTLDTLTGSVGPMPFEVIVTGWNDTTSPTDTVYAIIDVPPDLLFASPDSPASSRKRLSKPILQSGEQGSASWFLRHEPTVTDRSYLITVQLSTSSDTTSCTAQVRIPRQPTAFFTFQLTTDGPPEFCMGDSVILDAGEYSSYLWNNGSVSRRITVKSSGDYYCTVKDFSGYTGISSAMRVVVHPIPSVTVTKAAPSPLCQGDSVWLQPQAEFSRYHWSDGSTARQLLVSESGRYILTVWNEGDCSGSDTIEVTFIPLPVKPVISRSGDTLSVPDAGGSIRWYRDGRLLVTSFTRHLPLTHTGSYIARRTSPAGCVSDSEPFIVAVLGGVQRVPEREFALHVWPYPSSDELHIVLRSKVGEQVRIVLTDVLGKSDIVYSGRAGEAGVTLRISLQGRARGPLFIHAQAGEQRTIKKVMRN